MTRDEALAAYREAVEKRRVARKAYRITNDVVEAAWEVYLTTIKAQRITDENHQ